MKRIVAVLLTAVIAITFFACGKKEGDLGKQTTVDKKNGYTLVEDPPILYTSPILPFSRIMSIALQWSST